MIGNIRREVLPDIDILADRMAARFGISRTLADSILLPPDGGERDMGRIFDAAKAVAEIDGLSDIRDELFLIRDQIGEIQLQIGGLAMEVGALSQAVANHDKRRGGR